MALEGVSPPHCVKETQKSKPNKERNKEFEKQGQ
jgi:hypothetical protein